MAEYIIYYIRIFFGDYYQVLSGCGVIKMIDEKELLKELIRYNESSLSGKSNYFEEDDIEDEDNAYDIGFMLGWEEADNFEPEEPEIYTFDWLYDELNKAD